MGKEIITNPQQFDSTVTITADLSASKIYLTEELNVGSGATVLFVGSNKVGINTETPNEALTVAGSISAADTLYAVVGNSNLWNSVYSTVASTSSTYVRTVQTSTPGISAVTMIVAVSALPATQDPNTLYILF